MKVHKMVVLGGAGVVGTAFVVWVVLWVQFLAWFPPEQVYAAAVSPDGSKAARFSVKYEGICRWLPSDIEPHYYLTIVDTVRGRILLRASEYQGDMQASFRELARKHARWAVGQLASGEK